MRYIDKNVRKGLRVLTICSLLVLSINMAGAELLGQYYNDPVYRNDPEIVPPAPDATRNDPNIAFCWHCGDPLPPGISSDGWWSADWTGFLIVPIDGNYQFKMNSDDGSWLYIDDELVIDNNGDHAPRDAYGSKDLTVGYHNIKVKYFESYGGAANIYLYWTVPGSTEEIIPPDAFVESPTPPVPELPTVLLTSVGILGLLAVIRKKK